MRIGTRKSTMALAQTEDIARRLSAAAPELGYARRPFPQAEVIHFRGAADTRVRKLARREMQLRPGGGELGPADALIMYLTIEDTAMSLTASVLDEAGEQFIEVSRRGPVDRPRELGRAVALELLDKGAAEIIARTRIGP